MQHDSLQRYPMAVCIAACLSLAACTSVERFTDRQQRYRRYAHALRTLPESATRLDIYRALPPQTQPAPPRIFTLTGLGASATEFYPLDADYEVAVPFLYARSPFIYQGAMAHFDSSTPHHLTHSIQSPQDMIYVDTTSIERRNTKRFIP